LTVRIRRLRPPANLKEDRIDRRLAENQSGKRKVVVVIREHGGETLPGVFASEGAPSLGSSPALRRERP
jgi:hypothetical protein